MAKLFLGLGSNLGDRGDNIQKALAGLERMGIKILRTSGIYETEPVGYAGQPWFYNIAASAETALSPHEVLEGISAVEKDLGRLRTRRKGPRTIDIDILIYGDLVLKTQDLQVPHPEMARRNFVLAPLAEIAPKLAHPVLKKSIGGLLKECGDKAIVRPL